MSESKPVNPIVISHYTCPHCNSLDSMLVEKLEDKKGICVECFREIEFDETR